MYTVLENINCIQSRSSFQGIFFFMHSFFFYALRKLTQTKITLKARWSNLLKSVHTQVVMPRDENLAMWSSKLMPPTPITSIWSAGLFRVLEHEKKCLSIPVLSETFNNIQLLVLNVTQQANTTYSTVLYTHF